MALENSIRRLDFAPYVYAYPPTRMYTSIPGRSVIKPVFTKNLNVYIHIPFCEQKCTFCGYLTVIDTKGDLQDIYVDCIVKEIEMHRDRLGAGQITSINFGGGTPSLLTVEQFEKIMSALVKANPTILTTAKEVSIEATPESIQNGKISEFKSLGINRVSVGIQTFNNEEIELSKRHNLGEISVRSVKTLQDIQIPNVCCDLMYGLMSQTLSSWTNSVSGLLELRPDTIELYSTVIIPNTPLAKLKIRGMSNQERLRCYEYARETFFEAGYLQDCHLRFILPGRGGYIQQENVFAGESLLGFGVGARSYATNIHYRNSYNGSKHREALGEYIGLIQNNRSAVSSAVNLDYDERMRRYVIYNLEHLNKDKFETKFGLKFENAFPNEYCDMVRLDLAVDDGSIITLTTKGFLFRDVIANEFFSKTAKGQESYYYQTVAVT